MISPQFKQKHKKETTEMARRQTNAGSAAPFYEDFQPKSELKEEQGAHLLQIRLPDFSNEQIRVIYVDSTRTVRVQGERPLGNNKWSRFNRTFPVPENCIVDKIHGKFQEGILTITIPKQTIAPQQPAAVPKQEGTKITPKEKEPSPVLAPPPKEPTSEAVPPPPKPAAPAQLPERETTGKDQKSWPAFQTPLEPITEPKVQKGQEQGETSAKATPKQSTEIEGSQTKDKEKKVDASKAPPYESKSQKQEETPSLFETKKKTEKKGDVKEETSFMEKATGIKNRVVETMKTAMEKKEDRHLIVNVGVAVLVIVAVGAYVTYKIRSSAKPKD